MAGAWRSDQRRLCERASGRPIAPRPSKPARPSRSGAGPLPSGPVPGTVPPRRGIPGTRRAGGQWVVGCATSRASHRRVRRGRNVRRIAGPARDLAYPRPPGDMGRCRSAIEQAAAASGGSGFGGNHARGTAAVRWAGDRRGARVPGPDVDARTHRLGGDGARPRRGDARTLRRRAGRARLRRRRRWAPPDRVPAVRPDGGAVDPRDRARAGCRRRRAGSPLAGPGLPRQRRGAADHPGAGIGPGRRGALRLHVRGGRPDAAGPGDVQSPAGAVRHPQPPRRDW